MEPVDLFSSETFEREIPHEYFAWLRENEAVHWQPRERCESGMTA